ncbi:DNA polymerase [Terracoccus luteus]|uniref:DNA-directed DNA polymerase n=1 Tax=Terracoccus luteus TaxID=53356 RepID=A0A839PVM7_9MICO|nr:DNA polymerase [Terracoccus luteus]MBB2987113.1 DNA polymerase-1 [Terracoccus luteus]MCP2172764.1 DNA polymerase-1 [Terracoccus luteus]
MPDSDTRATGSPVVSPGGSPVGFPVVLVVAGASAHALGEGVDELVPREHLPALVTDLERRRGPRWVVWSAASGLRDVVDAGVAVGRCWDLAEAHRLLHGGWAATPGHVWAACRGLDEDAVPRARAHRRGFDADLFDVPDDPALVDGAGHLRADALGAWAGDPGRPTRLRELAGLALRCRDDQARSVASLAGDPDTAARLERVVWSESAAAVLCLELERDGLPIDRATAVSLIADAAGPRASDERDAARIRAERDALVLRHAPPGREQTDLRNPAQVKALLAAAGVDVPNTRAWVLEPYRASVPLVEALLRWRADERIATTYGYRWLDSHVGPDDRLRGAWSACDGAAGRMTAQNGLHNLPASLRPAVAAEPGHVLVRADLGQVEPRVLAVVSGDRSFAAATRADDLYAPVAAELGTERAKAKIAVLAAMYGQRSGAAGQALGDLERRYPVAMGLLDRAYADGVARRPLRTWGGRLIRLGAAGPPLGEGAGADEDAPGIRATGTTDGGRASAGEDGAARAAHDAARGRYARNAVIQGSAAELFKAWAATVRASLGPVGGRIVLCLHDELLVHVPVARADETVALVARCLDDAARRWAGTDAVRFVTDTSVVGRWSDAKG